MEMEREGASALGSYCGSLLRFSKRGTRSDLKFDGGENEDSKSYSPRTLETPLREGCGRIGT